MKYTGIFLEGSYKGEVLSSETYRIKIPKVANPGFFPKEWSDNIGYTERYPEPTELSDTYFFCGDKVGSTGVWIPVWASDNEDLRLKYIVYGFLKLLEELSK